nr:immunoglobulin heavy chain junction region [Macaca mulatta]MOX04390.1 immunoglobulin heavy chain junction region [Macaca mulatta]
CARDHSAFDFW